MQAHSFNCPNCGAPLDVPDQRGGSSFRCKFCNTSILVPETANDPLKISPAVSFSVFDAGLPQASTAPTGKSARMIFSLIGLIVVLAVGGFIISILTFSGGAAVAVGSLLADDLQSDSPILPQALIPSATPRPSATPTATPTPQFAEQSLVFGEEGIAPGLLSDARYIAVGADQIFVAEYSGGRVQAFDETGKYLRQWRVGEGKNTIIAGLAADRDGRVFVAVGGAILVYDGTSGEPQATFTNPAGGGFGDLATGADGKLYAAWYEARFGMITSLQGHRDDLVIFNPDGPIDTTLPGWMSAQSETLALDTLIAVDGEGNIFALDTDAVAISKFSSTGKFLTRFGSSGDGAGSLGSHPSSLAVDGQGRVYVGDGNTVHVFSNAGAALTDFKVSGYADAMAFDAQNRLWVVARDKVLRLELTKP